MEARPEAAVAVLKAKEPVESILLIHRATNPADPWSGHWSFPGGRREDEDPDLLTTAIRELQEECSIILDREQLSRELPASYAGKRMGNTIAVVPFLFEVSSQLEANLNPREADDYIWTPVALLADLSRHRWQRIPGFPQQTMFPALDLKGTPLWGFTYRVLCDLLGIEMPTR
jgi:8-oxo-dGTP diphosphatase